MSSLYWLARSGIALAGVIPGSLRYSLSSGLSSASYLAWSSKRQVTRANMAQVLNLPVSDPKVGRIAFESWSNYGRTASDLIYFPHMNMEKIEGKMVDLTHNSSWREKVELALKPGKGVVIATAHFGSWDIAGALVARHYPLSAIAETFTDPQFNQLMQGHRLAKKVGVIPMENAPRQVLRELQQNRMVAIVGDRPMTSETGVQITFFGRTTYVPAGPAALALRAGAAIMPGFVWYGRRGQLFVRAFEPVTPQPVSDQAGRNREISRLTQCIYDALEEMVREFPSQWFMFRPFWPAEKSTQE